MDSSDTMTVDTKDIEVTAPVGNVDTPAVVTNIQTDESVPLTDENRDKLVDNEQNAGSAMAVDDVKVDTDVVVSETTVTSMEPETPLDSPAVSVQEAVGELVEQSTVEATITAENKVDDVMVLESTVTPMEPEIAIDVPQNDPQIVAVEQVISVEIGDATAPIVLPEVVVPKQSASDAKQTANTSLGLLAQYASDDSNEDSDDDDVIEVAAESSDEAEVEASATKMLLEQVFQQNNYRDVSSDDE